MHRFAKISVLLVLFAVSAGYTYVRAQDLNAPAPTAKALVAHALKASYFDAAALGTVASCGALNCSASVTMFNESIKCPAVAGNTCTFQIAIASGVQVAGNSSGLGEEGVYQFLVDGAPPSSGTGSGFYEWSINEPNSGALFGTSSAVAGKVKNTVSGQAHTVTVNLGCFELGRDSQGCVAVANFPSLHIAVFTP